MNEKKKSLILIGIIAIFVLLITVGIIGDNAKSKKELDKFMNLYNSSEQHMILIGKDACSYCQAFKPNMDFMAQHYGFKYEYIDVEKLNASHYNKLLETLNLAADDFGTPYTVVTQNGKKVDELAGAVEEDQLFSFLKKYKYVSENEKLLINYVNYNGYEKALYSKDAQVIAIGKSSCIYCKMVKATLNKIIKENKITINYLNLELLTEDELKKLYSSLDFFGTEDWGTPTFLIVKEGKLLGSISGMQEEQTFISEFKKYNIIGD